MTINQIFGWRENKNVNYNFSSSYDKIREENVAVQKLVGIFDDDFNVNRLHWVVKIIQNVKRRNVSTSALYRNGTILCRDADLFSVK